MTTAATETHTETSTARRIGFLADTHVKEPGELGPAVQRAFAGVDLIVHCGHFGNIALLDWLNEIAPTIGVGTGLDQRQNEAVFEGYASRLAMQRRVIETPWAAIGVQFNLSGMNNAIASYPPPYSSEQGAPSNYVVEQFGRPVDVVVWANTHTGSIHMREGVLFVDPGSPNLPSDWRQGGPGTVAIIEEHEGFVRAEIVDLRAFQPARGSE